jgi:hypothetical protein
MRLTLTTWFTTVGACALFGANVSTLAQENNQQNSQENTVTEEVRPIPRVRVTSSSTSGGAVMSDAAGQPQLLSDLLDAQVLLQNGDPAGDITDLVLGRRGNILFAVARHDDGNYLIPFRGMNFNAAEQLVQLNLTPEQFAQVPFFEGRNLPNLGSPAVRRQITSLFGPGPMQAEVARRADDVLNGVPRDVNAVPNGRDDGVVPPPDDLDTLQRGEEVRARPDRARPAPPSKTTGQRAEPSGPPSTAPVPGVRRSTIGGASPRNPGGTVPSTPGFENPNIPGGARPTVPGGTGPGSRPIGPATPGGTDPNVPGGRQPNVNAPVTPGTPGGPPIAPPGPTTTPPPRTTTPVPGPNNPGTTPPRAVPRASSTGDYGGGSSALGGTSGK